MEWISKWGSLYCGEQLGEEVLRRVFSAVATPVVVEPLQVQQRTLVLPCISVPACGVREDNGEKQGRELAMYVSGTYVLSRQE